MKIADLFLGSRSLTTSPHQAHPYSDNIVTLPGPGEGGRAQSPGPHPAAAGGDSVTRRYLRITEPGQKRAVGGRGRARIGRSGGTRFPEVQFGTRKHGPAALPGEFRVPGAHPGPGPPGRSRSPAR
eukprot:748698-Hanusia_phi.AAC.1